MALRELVQVNGYNPRLAVMTPQILANAPGRLHPAEVAAQAPRSQP